MNHAAFQRREGHAGDRLRRRIAASHYRLHHLRLGKSICAVIDEAQKYQPSKTKHAPQKDNAVSVSRPTTAPTAIDDSEEDREPVPSDVERPRTVESIAVLQVDASAKSRTDALQSITKPPQVDAINGVITRREQAEADMGKIFEKRLGRMASEPTSPARPRRDPGLRGQGWFETGEESRKAPQDRSKPKEMFVKVEKWHRDMVWRQKFDFFDRQIGKQIQESIPPKDTGTPDANVFKRSPTSRPVSRDTKRPVSRNSSSGRPRSSGSSAPKTSGRPDSRSSTRNQHAGTAPGPLGPLQASASAPQLNRNTTAWLSPGLNAMSGATLMSLGFDEIKYYEGDELLMHEDILHSSNPRLFPLRGHEKLFPLGEPISSY